jgi:phage I-like protein
LSSALYIVLENKIPNLDEFVNGKYLSKELETLQKLSKQIGVKPLMSFVDVELPGSFAAITSTTGTPRVVQLSIRYAF